VKSRLNYRSHAEERKLKQALAPLGSSIWSPMVDRATLERQAELLSEAAIREPKEWIYYYTLCDIFQTLGDLAQSMQACQVMGELRPNDIRTLYAMSTTARILARAYHVGDREFSQFMKGAFKAMPRKVGEYDPVASLLAIEEVGWATDGDYRGIAMEFAYAAYGALHGILEIGVEGSDLQLVRSNILGLRREFPFLVTG
jgi:hypothetical protein